MRSAQGSEIDPVEYLVLRSPGQEPEIARVNAQGVAAFYEPMTQTWINDPLLSSEILINQDWRPAVADELPDGIDLTPTSTAKPRRRRPGRRKRPRSHQA